MRAGFPGGAIPIKGSVEEAGLRAQGKSAAQEDAHL